MSGENEDLLLEWLNADAGVFFRRGLQLESIRTSFQELEVFDTPALGKMFRLDGANMTSERDEFFYHENIVHPCALAQDSPCSALIIGGGDGGSAEEILKHPGIERVLIAELDPEVVRIARTHFSTVHRGALDDPRVEIRIGDGERVLRQLDERFDLLIMDLTDPVGPAEKLYTATFYREADRVLRPTGTLSLHVGSPFFHPQRFTASLRTLQQVFPIVRPYFVHVPLYGANWGMACASRETDPLSLSADEVDRRIADRGLARLRYLNGDTLRAGFALPNFVRQMLSPR